ncbi:MAG: sodium/solute symporter [Alteromonadaceae bacterium]|nr:sodium/solute symporter [Alteromonadaceae bacterium]
MTDSTIQVIVFCFIIALIAFLTYLKCAGQNRHSADSNKEYFLAGGGLSWMFVAGSITLTNLSTDQLVGMNGNQMMLLAWWEFAAFFGLIILAKVFVPVYYKYNCTTTTELLEKRYNSKHIRAMIALMFLCANVLIFQPAVIYSGALFMISMFGADDIGVLPIATVFAFVGAGYAIFGGLRAVAVSDTYSGILILFLGMLIVFMSMAAIDYDFSQIPAERLTLIGDNDSPLPWHTLLTGMIFIQVFYWSTNQTITQRAMAAPSVKEAQKGIFAAAGIRLLLIPAMIVVPGIVSFQLYGDIGDAAYGRIVGDVLPSWLSGVFAAGMAAAVLSTFNSQINSSAAMYVCDLHERYINDKPNVPILSGVVTFLFVVIAIALVPVYAQADSIINLLQELWGLVSMPILSAFIVGLLFKNVDAIAAIIAVISGVLLYAYFSFVFMPLHYIHMMLFTLIFCVAVALFVNRFILGKRAELLIGKGKSVLTGAAD